LPEVEARAAWQRLFDEVSPASREFLLGMAMDLAKEDPAPKKPEPARKAPVSLKLVFG
jgi:hypothetical protein